MADPNQQPKILVGHVDDESTLPDGVVLHKSRDVDAPARVERVPSVVDEEAEITRTKEIFERGIAKLYDQAIAVITAGQWLSAEHTLALKQHRDRALDDLRGVMADPSQLPSARTKAAEGLIGLQEPSGETFLFDSLESESADLRLAALKSLRQWGLRADFTSPERAQGILALLDDSDERVVAATAELCQFRAIAGTEVRLTESLEGSTLKNPEAIATALAEVATSRRAVDALLPHVLSDIGGEYSSWTGYSFRKLIEHPDPDVAGPVRKALYGYTLKFPHQRYDQAVVRDLASSADDEAIPVLEDIATSASDRVSRGYAVEALARLQPEKAIDLLVAHMREVGARSDLVQLVRKYAAPGDYDRIVPLLVEHSKSSGRPLDTEAVKLLLVEFKGRGEPFVRDNMDNLTDDARMWAAWKLEGLNLASALDELHAAGVIKKTPGELIEEVIDPHSRLFGDNPRDTSDPDSLIAALALEEIVVMFDAETGTIPCDHDQLIFTFADASAGAFSPQWPIQFWHQAGADDYNGPYTVQFVLDGRLFRTGAENYGDWYDVEAVVRLINFSLETTGRPQRFITLDSNGQVAAFVFADPAKFLPIAEKYRLPLSQDAAKAMRKGIEFERQVIEGAR